MLRTTVLLFGHWQFNLHQNEIGQETLLLDCAFETSASWLSLVLLVQLMHQFFDLSVVRACVLNGGSWAVIVIELCGEDFDGLNGFEDNVLWQIKEEKGSVDGHISASKDLRLTEELREVDLHRAISVHIALLP